MFSWLFFIDFHIWSARKIVRTGTYFENASNLMTLRSLAANSQLIKKTMHQILLLIEIVYMGLLHHITSVKTFVKLPKFLDTLGIMKVKFRSTKIVCSCYCNKEWYLRCNHITKAQEALFYSLVWLDWNSFLQNKKFWDLSQLVTVNGIRSLVRQLYSPTV